jgi:hypothetical protein
MYQDIYIILKFHIICHERPVVIHYNYCVIKL